MLDLNKYGTSAPFSFRHQDLVRLITAGGNPLVTDPLLINAFRMIDRGQFLPESIRDLAYQDRLLPVAYDEYAINPSQVARMLSAFAPQHGHHYLHIGSGTGYVSTLLAHVAGAKGRVYALERVQWLWEKSREYSNAHRQSLKLDLLYRDGSNGLADKAPYDGILVNFVFAEDPLHLLDQIVVGGKLMYPKADHTMVILEKGKDGIAATETLPGFNALAFGKHKMEVI